MVDAPSSDMMSLSPGERRGGVAADNALKEDGESDVDISGGGVKRGGAGRGTNKRNGPPTPTDGRVKNAKKKDKTKNKKSKSKRNRTMNTQQSRASILLLCGLPASGKSTVARYIVHSYKECHGDCRLIGVGDELSTLTQMDVVASIEYDAIAEQASRQQHKFDSSGSLIFTTYDLEAWRMSRIAALNVLKNTLSDHFSDFDKDKASLLIVMDDNFHLRSMRRDIYRICQDFLASSPGAVISFSVAYIATPLKVCLERNDLRIGKQHIPPDVLTRMDATIEPPDGSKSYASFEMFNITINNSTLNAVNDNILHDIDQCIKKSLQSPVQAKKVRTAEETAQMEQEREFQRVETLKCQAQRIDLLLRRLVGAVGRVDKKRIKEANETRKSIMERAKIESNINSMNDGYVVQQFACKMLGVDAAENWQAVNTPLTKEIQQSYHQFLSIR